MADKNWIQEMIESIKNTFNSLYPKGTYEKTIKDSNKRIKEISNWFK